MSRILNRNFKSDMVNVQHITWIFFFLFTPALTLFLSFDVVIVTANPHPSTPMFKRYETLSVKRNSVSAKRRISKG